MGNTLERHPFSGLVHSARDGFRLPWPPSGCLDELTPFVVSDERVFGNLNLAFGSSRIASSAYQKWPTRLLTYLKFENRLRLFQPQCL
ncbi:hypothetical protein P175DRAFT_0512814 [Aspergillus ochraceoroseus IBT 24754]|uniref:Uncharacterized protein n=1 Tax=Aspergillus ochraceoroseus IBT 24754 TaxID=1392256 RepID=A0A2T5LKI1_9EURO|nr:hypothetical protein P175DRAFT_0512814 [Aspergillus ochraceoroseus IBT 24754]